MKTIVNKLRFLLVLGFVALGMTAWSQAVPYINKMSISTQMFLDEMAGRINLNDDGTVPIIKAPGTDAPLLRHERPIATPDTIDGKVYISASIRVTDIDSDVKALEELGIIIQCKFNKGLVTALIPVDKINDVNNLVGVKRIEVATIMRSLTNLSRTASNVDDILTLSNDARAAGLSSIYDGSGVVLAVIDDGIDFQHKAFTDKNGNTRIKGAYCYNGTSVTADWTGSGTLPTTDDTEEDHGTHTSSIAGGSSVIVSGTNVTVTDNHANATYGGMAPGADLFLCGTQLYDTYIMNSFQKACNYADTLGKPIVVSNSWGGSVYANDGNTNMNDIFEQYFGDDNPNHICLFASGNEAGKSAGGVTGGYYVTGTSTSANPLGTIIRTESYAEGYGYAYVNGILANAWTRATDATGIAVHGYIINKTTGALVYDMGTLQSTNYNAGSGVTWNANNYFGRSRNFTVYFDYSQAEGKHQALIYTGNSMTSGTNYALAFEVYPIGGSNSTVDIWGGMYSYLAGNVTTSGHTWTAGTDDMSATGECTNENVISVGSYVTRTRSGSNSVGQISDFSSYALASTGPKGVMFPWITAPGEDIISGYNHYVSSHDGTVSVSNSTAPYGLMSGTSMACPAAAGIVALWFQAAQEVGKDLTMSEVKNIMAQTAIHDQWTNGTYSGRFGNGKINALGGIEYILNNYGTTDPTIRVSTSSVNFTSEPGGSYSETVVVTGLNLTGNITATLNDPNGVYSINTTNLGSGGNLVITFNPLVDGLYPATITLTSPGADPITITISGLSETRTDITVCDKTNTEEHLPVYGYYYDEAQVNQMLYPASLFTGSGMNGNKIKKITFYPTSNGNTSGINFYYQASRGNGTVTVKLANMPAGTTGYDYNATHKNANFTTVKTITMPGSAQTGLTEWIFDNLSDDFVYEGGDLLVEVTTETGMYGHTYFAGENQSSYTGYYSYGSSVSRGLQFLPKMSLEWESSVPITAGTVSPNSLTFTDIKIGGSNSQTVTITNTGNQAFTPVIDTANLPEEFTVTGNGLVAVNGTLDLTVTYSPTDEGPHSGSFTVTIGDVTYTVTVTGNGIIVNSTLYSNEVMVKVFKSNLQANDAIAYNKTDIDNDTDHGLPAKNNSGDVIIQVLGDQDITSYELLRKQEGESTWSSVATANNSNNTYTQVNHADNTVTVANGATAWLALLDDAGITSTQVYYIPVTNATSVAGNPNTYGAQRQSASTTDVSALIYSKVMSSDYGNNEGHTWTVDDKVYTHYTILLDIDNLIIPTSEVDETQDYDLYKVRVWRQIDPAYLAEEIYTATNRLGYNRQERITGDFLMEEVNNDDNPVAALSLSGVHNGTNGNTGFSEYKLGSRDDLETFHSNWTQSGTDEVMGTFGAQKLREYDGETGVIEALPMTFIVRAYYTRTANLDLTAPNSNPNIGQAPRRDGEAADGNFYIVEYTLPFTLDANDSEIVTSVGSIFTERQVVGVTYVNALGQQSDKPFDGVNIVITRYNDGSVTTSKVLK